jgi:GNAT superfamily N-acetyltransferase
MAIESPQPNGTDSQPPIDANGILPGTTFAEKDKSIQANDTHSTTEPQSSSGPQVHGKSTTLTLFSPTQLARSPLLPSLYRIVNDAFRVGHERNNNRFGTERLQYEGQLHDELGNKPGTFTYILCYSGTDEVVATASAKPHAAELRFKQPGEIVNLKNGKDTTWTRLAPIAEGKEAWELSTMAVNPSLQRQGLAGYLMRVMEEEVKRRFKAGSGGAEGKDLVLVITTVKERNEEFYARRGFGKDYEIWYDKGHVGSEQGFHVIFMSKEVEL